MCIYGKIFINFHDESSHLIFIIEHVMAVNFVFENNTKREINYSTKFKWNKHKSEIKNLLDYLFNANQQEFIWHPTRQKFFNFFRKHQNFFNETIILDLVNHKGDHEFLSCVHRLLLDVNENTIQEIRNDPNSHKEFHHIILIFVDYLLLPDIFMREFKRDKNEIKINQYCHTVKNIHKKVHPDCKLAVDSIMQANTK